MSRTTLTVRTVEAIKPRRVRQEVPDRHMPGLYLVVQPSGTKSWAVRYRAGGQSRKHTLGSYPAIDLKAARALASKALRAAAEGRDPGREKARARTPQPNTVEAVAQLFVERHCRRVNRPGTAAETQRLLNTNVLPRWRKRLLGDIARRDVIDLLDGIVEAGAPIVANRVLSAFRKLCGWAVERDIISTSPCAGVKPPSTERSRDRVLDDDEVRHLRHAADQIDYPFGPMTKLLLLTGQRRDEVAGMRWSEIDIKRKLWKLPADRVKNNREHDVPLSAAVLDVLAAVPRIAGSEFVFTTTGTTPVSGFSKGKRRLDAKLPADMASWRLHDLRRSVASGMARLGINLPVIEKVLNHSSGSFAGIVGVYQRHDFAAEKRAALEAWGRHVLSLTRPPNVIALQA